MKCALLYKRIQLKVPGYLIEQLKLNSSVNSRNTRFSNLNYLNFLTPKYTRKTEGGKTFTVTSIQEWNNLPAELKNAILDALKTLYAANV